MILKQLTIVNYRNISEAVIDLSANVNCIVGSNGMGKTNILDAIYYLSFCKSGTNSVDALNVSHGADYMMLRGEYERDDEGFELIDVSFKKGTRKRVRRGGKEYKRLSEHLGNIPLIMIAPGDEQLVSSGAEERRRFMDIVISQYDSRYVESLIRYEQSLKQRNALMKQEDEPNEDVLDVLEQLMDVDAVYIYEQRSLFVKEFLPYFKYLYSCFSDQEEETVALLYSSHLSRGALQEQLKSFRAKERIVGYTLHGVHRDDLELLLNEHNLRYEGSQGQRKTFVIAMKLAQFLFLKSKILGKMPILLLDDIFDKLDAQRVSKIVEYVSGNELGQIFITDTNREHIDKLLAATIKDYKLFSVDKGIIHDLSPKLP